MTGVPTSSNARRQRIVTWALWLVSATLVIVAMLASAKAGCGATGARDRAVLGAALVSGLAAAYALRRPLCAWQAVALSVVVTVVTGGGLLLLGLLFWVHDCAN